MIPALAHTIWAAASLPELARFRLAAGHPRDAQRDVLRRLLRVNADTEFGREHAFSEVRDEAEYQRRVPLRTFEDLQAWVDRAAAGVPRVLTRGRVRLFEPTSGSTAATKLVPYTGALRREFHRGILAWVADLFLARPGLLGGSTYWSVSPPCARGRTAGGIPIGFDADAAYLGGWQQHLVRAAMVAPRVPAGSGVDRFQYLTLLALVGCGNLRLVSVWNPTFLTVLVERLPEWGDALARDVTDRRRADAIRAALRAGSAAERHAIVWPELRLISCWADANAAGPARELAALFPYAEMQGKGLIATEAFVSFPLAGHDGHALAVRSHFLEFEPVDAQGASSGERPRLAHELDIGGRYAVIVSTGGGLYRYRLQDVVEVAGRLAECPLIRFGGRQGHVSDWFGEKLHEGHVARALRGAFDAAGIAPRFSMLACDTTLRPPAYVLYIESDAADEVLRQTADRVDGALRASFHYNHARLLGQLGPIRPCRAPDAAARYLAALAARGQRPGDIKPPALSPADGWGALLHPMAGITPVEPDLQVRLTRPRGEEC